MLPICAPIAAFLIDSNCCCCCCHVNQCWGLHKLTFMLLWKEAIRPLEFRGPPNQSYNNNTIDVRFATFECMSKEFYGKLNIILLEHYAIFLPSNVLKHKLNWNIPNTVSSILVSLRMLANNTTLLLITTLNALIWLFNHLIIVYSQSQSHWWRHLPVR